LQGPRKGAFVVRESAPSPRATAAEKRLPICALVLPAIGHASVEFIHLRADAVVDYREARETLDDSMTTRARLVAVFEVASRRIADANTTCAPFGANSTPRTTPLETPSRGRPSASDARQVACGP